jgi:serine/threonine-protein kinase
MREMGNTLFQLGRYFEAERYFDRAISLSPEAPLTYIIKSNMYLLWEGDIRKSHEVLELVPTVYSPWRSFVELDICSRNYPAALERLTKVAERAFVGQHEITPVPQLRGFIYRFQGDMERSRVAFDSARVWLESELKRRPEDQRLVISLGLVLAGLGRKEEAIREAERAVALLPLSTDAVAAVWPLIGLAQVHVLVGNHDAALDRMEFLLTLRAPKYLTVPLLRLDPVYDVLRNNRRFQALLARYG